MSGIRKQNRLLRGAGVAASILCVLAGAACAGGGPGFDPPAGGQSALEKFKDEWTPAVYRPEQWGWPTADIAVLAGLLVTGSILVLTRRGAGWMTAHIAVALLYLGLFRGGCICPVGAVANASLGLASARLIGRATLVIFTLPLIVALLFGRVFCGAVCPLGAVQQLLARKKPLRIPRKINAALSVLPAVTLAATAWLVIRGLVFLVCRLDPYKPVFWQAHALSRKALALAGPQFTEPGITAACDLWAWLILGGAVILGFFVTRPFCRFVCPYGVLLGLLGLLSFRRRRIDQDACTRCGRCEKTCPVQAITVDRERETARLNNYRCVHCGRCSAACAVNAVR